MDRPAEIDLLCRLCLVKDRVDIPIFEEQGDIRQIFLKISCCLPISISLEDSLPKKICDNCSIKLDSLYDFWNCTVNAEKTLLTWLGQAGVKDAGNTITAVAQQIAKPESQIVKVEDIPDLIDGGVVEDDEEEERPQKRARRSAAVKAQETIANVVGNEEDDEEPSAKKARSSVDEDDSDEDEASMKDNDDDDDDEGEDFEGIEPKMEDEGDESEGEVKPTFDAIPGTSAQDQPGPSGVGKIEADAPFTITVIKRESVTEDIEIQMFLKQEPLEIKEEAIEDFDWISEENFQECDVSLQNTEQEDDTSHSTKKFQCEFCSRYFAHRGSRSRHMQYIHSNVDSRNCHSNISKNSKDYLHEECKKIKCDLCDKYFKHKHYLHRHNKLHHSGKTEMFKCDFCEKFFKVKYYLQRHVKLLHSESNEIIKCDFCDQSFKLKHHLQSHVQRRHLNGNSKWKCAFCGELFSFKGDWSKHVKHHVENREMFKCDICDTFFKRKKYIIKHKLVHHSGNEQIVDCNFCTKSFKHEVYLKKHINRAHLEKKSLSTHF